MCKKIEKLLTAGAILFQYTAISPLAAVTLNDDADAAAYEAQLAALDGFTIDINHASLTELEACPLLSPVEARIIAEHRHTRGPLQDVDALAQLLEWRADRAELTSAYFTFRDAGPGLRVHLQSRVSARGKTASESRLLSRSTIEHPSWKLSLVTERDPGEPSLFDHAGGYLLIRLAESAALWVGDLRPGIGLGGVYARSGRSSVGSPAWSIRSATNLGTVGSAESGALRGAGITASSAHGAFLAAYGRTRWDAALDNGTVSIRDSGDHASEASRRNANRLAENTYLLSATLGDRDRLGFTVSRSVFDHPVQVDRSVGRTHDHVSVFGSAGGRNRTFAEVVHARIGRQRSHGALWGAAIVRRSLRVSATIRHLSPGYAAVRSAPSVAYTGGNERGFGLFARLTSRHVKLDAYLDRHWTIVIPAGWTGRRTGTRSRLTASLDLARSTTCDLRVSSLRESVRQEGMAQRSSRAIRLRIKTVWRGMRWSAWGEAARGADGQPGRALATGTEARVGHRAVSLDLWIARSHRSGRGARLYGFRPEVWGGRSVLLLPASGALVTTRVRLKLGSISLSSVYHHLPHRRAALQLDVVR